MFHTSVQHVMTDLTHCSYNYKLIKSTQVSNGFRRKLNSLLYCVLCEFPMTTKLNELHLISFSFASNSNQLNKNLAILPTYWHRHPILFL